MTREGVQKAVVAVVGAVVTVLAVAGIDADDEVVAAVSTPSQIALPSAGLVGCAIRAPSLETRGMEETPCLKLH
jgi:hypothetical protein